MASKYTLTYFEGRGRAEFTRLLFAQAGVNYKDVRITFDEWATVKPTTPFSHLPLLEVEGVTLSESMSIARYVAKKTGLNPSNPLCEAQADMVIDQYFLLCNRATDALVERLFTNDKAKEEEIIKEVREEKLPTIIGQLAIVLKKNGAKYFVENKLTWADIGLFDTIGYLVGLGIIPSAEEGLKEQPGLLALYKKVGALPGIAAWVKKRPESAF